MTDTKMPKEIETSLETLALERKVYHEYWDKRHFQFTRYMAGAKESWTLAEKYFKAKYAPLVEACKASLWIDNCRCDKAYTDRRRHEPNTYCGELDDVREALKKIGIDPSE